MIIIFIALCRWVVSLFFHVCTFFAHLIDPACDIKNTWQRYFVSSWLLHCHDCLIPCKARSPRMENVLVPIKISIKNWCYVSLQNINKSINIRTLRNLHISITHCATTSLLKYSLHSINFNNNHKHHLLSVCVQQFIVHLISFTIINNNIFEKCRLLKLNSCKHVYHIMSNA